VWRFINIRRNSSTRGSGCSTFILALALWRSLARRTNPRFHVGVLGRVQTPLLHAGHVQDVDFRHHFFNRAVQTPGDPFSSSSISRMYCGIASASGEREVKTVAALSRQPESGAN
jgi:hypothetical protein